MKRIILCIGILLAILIQSVASLMILKHKNNELSSLIDQAAYLAQNGDKEAALEKTAEIQDYWQDYYVKVSYLIQTSKLEDIAFSVSKLTPLLEKDSEEFFSECFLINRGIQLIFSNECPKLSSVL